MGTQVTLNGVSYTIPATAEDNWGTEVSNYLIALSTGALTKAGGAFTLTADVDFGANFGAKSIYYKSRGTTSATGVVRLANDESVAWRNAANSADLAFKVNASNILEFNGNPIPTLALGAADTVLQMNAGGTAYEFAKLNNANVDAAAAIDYSKLALTGGIVNADVNASAAIAYTKLSLTGGIVNADINASAAIELSKLAVVTASRALVSDAGGLITPSAVTATELGYLSGVTSAIQTQINALQSLDSDLTAIGGLGTTGLIARTGSGTASTRTVTAGSGKITVTDGDGVAGNPTIDVDQSQLTLTSIGGTLSIAKGGTGQTSASDAINALLPTQTGKSGQVLKTDGSTASWGTGGAGSGEKNYVTNPNGTSDTSGWSNVGDLDIARTTTAAELPRENTTPTGLKITADSNTQSVADYVYYDFTLDDVDVSKTLAIKWSQKVTGTYTDGQLAVVITTQADRTTALHTPIVTDIPSADMDFLSSFTTDTTKTLSLVIRATGDMTTDGGIVISDVVVGPTSIVQSSGGPTVDIASSCSLTNGGTSPTITFAKITKLGGDRAYLEVKMTLGTTTSGQLEFNIPSTYAMSGPTVTGLVGRATANTAGLVNLGVMATTAVSTTKLYFTDLEGSSDGLATINSNSIGDSKVISFSAILQIAAWAGAGYVGIGEEEYAYNSGGTWDAADSTSFGYGPGGKLMGGALTTQRIKRVRFPTPIQPTDRIEIQLSDNQVAWVPAASAVVGGVFTFVQLSAAGTSTTGSGVCWGYVSGSTTDIDVYFNRYSSIANDDAPAIDWTNTTYWRVVKYKKGAPNGFANVTQSNAGLVKSAGQLLGTNTNDSAAAGYVGEVMSASRTYTNRTALVNATAKTVCGPITLTPGDWDVSAMVAFDPNSATTWTSIIGSVSTVNNGLPAGGSDVIAVPSGGECRMAMTCASGTATATTPAVAIPNYRVTVAAGATLPLYLVAYSQFTTNTMSTLGSIQARRVR